MKERTLIAFAVVTAVVVVAAVAVQSARMGPAHRPAGRLLFPDLAAHVNDARTIAITRKGKTFTVKRTENGWAVTEKSGYPARLEEVKKTLIALSQLKTLEAKTRKPDLYPRLEVEDPASAEAESRQVTVTDKAGKTLAALIVGKRHFSRSLNGPDMVYVRKPGEAQSWLAEGRVDLGEEAVDWTERQIADVDRDRILRMTWTYPDGERLVIERPDPQKDTFAIANPPAGAKTKPEGEIGARASALTALDLDDVRPAKEVPFEAKAAGEAEFRTLDGLVVRIRMAKLEDKTWLSFAARVDEAGRAEPAGGAGKGSKAADGDGEKDGKALKPIEDVRREAEAINRRTRGWAYVVPDYKLKYLRTRLADLIEKKKGGKNKKKSG